MNHFEVHMMVSLRVVDSKVIQFGYFFFLIRRQNVECNIKNLRRFLFGISLDVLAFKVLDDVDFHRLTNFAKNIDSSWMVSLWYELLCSFL